MLDPRSLSILQSLERQRRRDGARPVADALTVDLCRELWQALPGHFGGLLREVIANLVREPPDEPLRDLLARLHTLDPRSAIEAIPDPVTTRQLLRLLELWPERRSHVAARRFRTIEDGRTDRPAWLLALVRLREGRSPVPERLRNLFESANTHGQRAGFRAYPAAFAALGPDLLPRRDLLRIAFTSPSVAKVVEERFSRDELTAELPWIRETYADTPAISAAWELATCFSLRDSRFLCQLARRVRPPSDPAERGRQFDDLYTVSERPKKSGGVRVITAPTPRLKRLQRRLLANGFANVPLHAAAHGFRPGASVLTNAQPHVGQPLVVNLDIRGFFPGTPYRHILRACRQLSADRLSPRALYLLADLCSYRGTLPTGAPTSPAIGNIVLAGVDSALARAAERADAVYTRYADDLTFSGPTSCKRLIPFARRVLASLGYEIDPRKTNLFRRGRRQMVTGLVVNDKVGWPRHLRRMLRAAVDRRARGGVPEWRGRPIGDEQLRGLIAFLNVTNPAEAGELRARMLLPA